MAASKSQLFSDSDKQFLAEQLGLELYYSRRDANTVYINRQRKSDAKLRFDRDHFKRVQIICAAFEAATGIAPQERQPANLDSFMSKLGRQFEDVQENEPVQTRDNNDIPWDMNGQF